MLLAANLLMLTGCASTTTLEWLRDEHANAIAEDLATAVATRVTPTKSPIFVAEMPLRDHFESAIREQGYAVAASPDKAIEITGLGERIPPNTWHVGLTIGEGIRVHRLYHINQNEVRALSSISVGDHPIKSQDTDISESTQWHLRFLERTDRASVDALAAVTPTDDAVPITHSTIESFDPEVDDAAPLPVASSDSACPSTGGAVFTLEPGSLKHAIETVLNHCGWSLTAWPEDSHHAGYVVDWIIEKPLFVETTSVNDFLDQIELTYDVVATRDSILKTVNVALVE